MTPLEKEDRALACLLVAAVFALGLFVAEHLTVSQRLQAAGLLLAAVAVGAGLLRCGPHREDIGQVSPGTKRRLRFDLKGELLDEEPRP